MSGGTEAASDQGNTLGCWRVQQLVYDSLNGVRTTQTILAKALSTLDRDASSLECKAAESCFIRIEE